MKVLISGGRVGVPEARVRVVLDGMSRTWPKDTVIIHGAAAGVDRFAGKWASDMGFRPLPMKIDPALDGHFDDAPKRRNSRMLLEKPDILIAFPGGPGTRDMLKKADDANVPIYEVEFDELGANDWTVHDWGNTNPNRLRRKKS